MTNHPELMDFLATGKTEGFKPRHLVAFIAEQKSKNFLDVSCPICGHIPRGQKHLCDLEVQTHESSGA